MGWFSNMTNGISNGITGLVSGVAAAATSTVSGIIQGAVSAVGSAAGSIITSATPMVGTVANSPAGSIMAAGFSGYTGSLNTSSSSNQVTAVQTIKNPQGRIVRLDSLTGLSKFFCYYKMDADGRVYLDDGKPTLNIGKLIAHATGLGVVVFGLFKLFKKRHR